MARSSHQYLAAIAVLCCAEGFAQDGAVPLAPAKTPLEGVRPESKAAAPGSESGREGAAAPLLRDLIYLPGPDGKLVPVPIDVTLEQFLNATRAKPPAETAPAAYAISSVSLAGSADDERATLACRIDVQINVDKEWIRVPLGLQDAVLNGSTHRGPGEQSFGGFDRESGHRWWFRGEGLHELRLEISAPIRRQGSIRRLQLALPSAASGSLSLTVPGQATGAKALPESAWVRTKHQELSSVLEVRGLSSRCDLSWQPVSNEDQAQTVLQSETSISLDIAEESLILEADQAIEALEGSFQEVRVRLPRGFELLDVEERTGRLASTKIEDPANPEFIMIRFNEPTKGPVLLHWTLEGAFASGLHRVALEGFEVERAVRQSGEILVASIDGFRLTRREGEDRFVHRVQPRQKPSGRPWSSGWRFLKQPFRLVLDVQELQPYFTIEPRWKVSVRSSFVELDGVLTVHVARDRGSVQKILLNWPDWKQEGWLPQVDDTAGSAVRLETDAPPADGKIQLLFESRRSGTFEVPFRARRPLPPGSAAFEMTLPHAESSARGPALVEFLCDENLETDILRTQPGAPVDPNRPATWSRNWKFRVEEEHARWLVRSTRHSREVRCETISDAVVRGQRVQVAQRCALDVRYEPLTQLHLVVPAALAGKIVVTLDDDVLPVSVVPQDSSDLARLRIPLPMPEMGRFEIVARFIAEDPEAAGDAKLLRVPILQVDDCAVTATRVRLPQDAEGDWEITGGDFQPGPAGGEWISFVASGARAEARMSRSTSRRLQSRSAHVDRAWHRTRVDAAGTVEGTVWLRVENPGSAISLAAPEAAEIVELTWDGLPAQVEETDRHGERLLTVVSPRSAQSGRTLLKVAYLLRDAIPRGALRTADIPMISADPSVPVQQSVWELELPAGQHLFESPTDCSPAFRWTRSWLYFHRSSSAPFQSVSQWISEVPPSADDETAIRNRYHFTRIGRLASVRFSVISFPMLVLLGAGAAWLGGLVLLKAPAARNAISLLTVAVTVVGFGLIWPSALAAMAQPAVVGLALALLMAGLETLFRRRPRSAVLTFSPASDSGRGPRGSSVRQLVGIGEELGGRRDRSSPAGSSAARIVP